MSAGACKVPINNRLQSELDSFHQLILRPGWTRLSDEQREAFFNRAIEIDRAAIRKYQALNDEIGSEIA